MKRLDLLKEINKINDKKVINAEDLDKVLQLIVQKTLELMIVLDKHTPSKTTGKVNKE